MAHQTTSEIVTYFRVCDGTRVRYADTRENSDTVILMLAPWPETLWAYRRVWDQISAVGRVVALDMPGFGHSDQPERLIAPDAMGDFLALLIDEWDLGAPHIVGPDVGTAAALFLGQQGTGQGHQPFDRRRSGHISDRSGRRPRSGDRGPQSR